MKTYDYIHTPLHYGNYSSNQIRRIVSKLESTTDMLRHISLKLKLLNSKLEPDELEPKVFVSHKSDDKTTAEELAIKIEEYGLKSYLDIWDSKVDGDGPELVDYINFVIGHCDSLIAVVSHRTVESWWVPLEIGVAIAKELYLGTFFLEDRADQNLPSYLWKWPVLKDMDDLENWCEERKKETSPQVFYESLKKKHPNMFRQ